ncbi:hypothetical protein ASF23_16905 [Curtobacterium sp. Leaf261]|nr:hypothetical protein ASF23_16905 [Curtobacterium sp. Leaf261]
MLLENGSLYPRLEMWRTDDPNELTPDEVRRHLRAQEQRKQLDHLRSLPVEWRRRGMLDPGAIRALVEDRLRSDYGTSGEPEVRYADFLSDAN